MSSNIPPLLKHENPTQVEGVLIEICGTCNAKCPWCITGCGGHPHGGKMSLEAFSRCVERLEKLGLLHSELGVCLYNWGEPTLNPELDNMLTYLGRRRLRGSISTNGIKPFMPSSEAAEGLSSVIFSVSGMTDHSEMRVHGVSASRVLENMEATLAQLRKHGWRGATSMSFHMYQHNVNEVPDAFEWCARHGVKFFPYFAYFNDFNKAEAYLAGRMDSALLIRASKELMLFYVDDLIKAMPPDWSCTLRNQQLVIDENANVRTCCALPADHAECVLGSIFQLELEDIRALKDRRRVCAGCEKSGLAWWATHVQGPEFFKNWIDDHRARLKMHAAVPFSLRKSIGGLIERRLLGGHLR